MQRLEQPTELNGRDKSLDSEIPELASAERERSRIKWFRPRFLYPSVAVVLLLVAGLLGIRMVRARSGLQLQPNDWVLVTRFENRTGEHDLDDVLDFALRSDLSDSRYAHIVSPERVQDTLRFMRKPPDTIIDQQVGREICLRDGGIRAMVVGRIDRFDASYLIGIAILDPQNGLVLRSFSAPAKDHTQMIPALNRLSSQIRENLGEAVGDIKPSEQQLEKATTPSLEALQLFSKAERVPDEGSVELLEQAIKLDPEFASAYLSLGSARIGIRDRSGAIESFRRAMELADKTSERERLLILQTWYGLQLNPGDLDKAVHCGELLTSLYPDFYPGISNQAQLLLQARRPDEAATMFDRALHLRPNAVMVAKDAEDAFAGRHPEDFNGQRPDLAEHFRTKAKEILARLDEHFLATMMAASEKYENGDTAGAEALLRDAHPANADEAHTLALANLSLGKLSQAETVAQSAISPEHIYALVAFLRGGVTGLRLYVREHSPPASSYRGITAVLYARVGAFRAAPNPTLSLPQQQARMAAIAGENAMAARRYSEAVPPLRAGIEAPFSPAQEMFLGNSLAVALEYTEDQNGAIAVLERTLADSSDDEIPNGILRPLIMAHLAHLYQQAGKKAKAGALEARLKTMLAVADADYSLDAQLADSPAALHRVSSRLARHAGPTL